MIDFKSYYEYSKKNNILLFCALFICYIIDINIQFFNLDDLIGIMNNLPINKLIFAKIFVTIIYSIFKLVSFIVIFSIYYFFLSGFLKNYFEEVHLKKTFIYFSLIANIIKFILMNFIIYVENKKVRG